MAEVRVLALYLPQFHPVKENDEIWGKGFTEWINVAKARPLFKGHYQPQLPSELGFYDLRFEENRIAQAQLAKEYGIEGFCYWHYWFGNGKTILDYPIQQVIKSGKPDFPFCFAWANHSWATSTWNNAKTQKKDTVFLKQEYLGVNDYTMHFNYVLPAFLDDRYVTVDGKPLFVVYDPEGIPGDQLALFIDTWNTLAIENGLKGIHFVARIPSLMRLSDSDAKERLNGGYINYYEKYLKIGFDAIWSNHMRRAQVLTSGYTIKLARRVLWHTLKISMLERYKYEDIINNWFTKEDANENVYPTLIPRWDKTPRQGNKAPIYFNGTPELFQRHVEEGIDLIQNKSFEHRILFLQAWNEWGEGNYIEPDIKYGRAYLEALKRALSK